MKKACPDPSLQSRRPGASPLFLLSLAWLVFQALTHAWVADDAYITFRTVDNIVHGLGATWNPDERVQAYTHPLWMLLHVPFYALFGHIYLVTTLLSFICFAFAVGLAIRGSGRTPRETALYFILPLSFAAAIMDYAASGLENPLSMALLAWFALLISHRQETKRFYFLLSLASSLIIINRLDLALLIAPAWLWLCIDYKKLRIGPIVAGMLPAIGWFSFSLFYYGFLFPNTKYAKLGTGLTLGDTLPQGLYYLAELHARDLPSFFLLLVGIAGALYGLVQLLRRRLPEQHQAFATLAAGLLLYAIYVIAIGGDFMGGRFWCLPVFLSLWLCLRLLPSRYVASKRGAALWLAAILALSGWSLYRYDHARAQAACSLAQDTRLDAAQTELTLCTFNGISDERRFYSPMTGLLSLSPFSLRSEPEGPWVQAGLHLRDNPPAAPIVVNSMGLLGYYAGPRVTLIDSLALAEPLLARLPICADGGKSWRIGHFARTLPRGYLKARATGDIDGMEPDLGDYYLKLRKVISAPLWDGARLRTLLELQLGRYDGELSGYAARHCR